MRIRFPFLVLVSSSCTGLLLHAANAIATQNKITAHEVNAEVDYVERKQHDVDSGAINESSPVSGAASLVDDCPLSHCRYGCQRVQQSSMKNDAISNPNGEDKTKIGLDGSWRCACPPGWTGEDCETCILGDDSGACRNGGTCVHLQITTSEKNRNTPRVDARNPSVCDCSGASATSNDFDDREIKVGFAGEYCQYPLATACHHDSMCHNNGKCYETSVAGRLCDCDGSRFVGPYCEYLKEEVPPCDLDCGSYGVCSYGKVPANHQRQRDELKLQDHADSYDMESIVERYCACRDGYIGRSCEYQTCPVPCQHGAPCILQRHKNDASSENTPYYTCDCSKTKLLTAGSSCQFIVTDDCQEAKATQIEVMVENNIEIEVMVENNIDLKFSDAQLHHRSFCVNGGTCRLNPAGITFCQCTHDYEGPHCEFEVGTHAAAQERVRHLTEVDAPSLSPVLLSYIPTQSWYPTNTHRPTESWYPTTTWRPTQTWHPTTTAHPTITPLPSRSNDDIALQQFPDNTNRAPSEEPTGTAPPTITAFPTYHESEEPTWHPDNEEPLNNPPVAEGPQGRIPTEKPTLPPVDLTAPNDSGDPSSQEARAMSLSGGAIIAVLLAITMVGFAVYFYVRSNRRQSNSGLRRPAMEHELELAESSSYQDNPMNDRPPAPTSFPSASSSSVGAVSRDEDQFVNRTTELS